MKLDTRLPLVIATPLSCAALHAIVVLASCLLLMTPFAAVGYTLFQVVLFVDTPVLQVFWDGEIATLLVVGSLQWLAFGFLVAIVSRWIEMWTKRSP